MAKTELPESENQNGQSNIGQNIKSKIAGWTHRIFGFTKFVFGVLLLPLVYSASIAFLNEFKQIDTQFIDCFWTGVICFVLMHLLVWEPALIYNKGHKILEFVFSFFKPLVKVAPYLLPIYTIVLFVIYLLLSCVIKSSELLNYFMFLFGFSIALHLAFSAKTLRSKKEDFLKSNYIFGFSFVYITNITLLSLFLNFIFEKFSFVNFSNQTFQIAHGIFSGIFRQLFITAG